MPRAISTAFPNQGSSCAGLSGNPRGFILIIFHVGSGVKGSLRLTPLGATGAVGRLFLIGVVTLLSASVTPIHLSPWALLSISSVPRTSPKI